MDPDVQAERQRCLEILVRLHANGCGQLDTQAAQLWIRDGRPADTFRPPFQRRTGKLTAIGA